MTFKGGVGWSLAIIAVTGCATTGDLEIRPVGQQSSAAGQPVSARIALARGQLALGNVALALEEFRRASREEPTNTLALAGMAHCYEQMGRFDLTRRYYEQALAISPHDSALALALAGAFDRQGQPEAAAALRREVIASAASSAPPSVTANGSVARLPEAIAEKIEIEPKAKLTVSLPPARKAAPMPTSARLERLSAGEVALITTDRSPWIARKVAATPRSVTIRFEKRPAILVLNAARVAGIAARTRDYLARRGFAGATIGDAPARRQYTLIRYPAAARARAERIAAQFPFAPRLESGDGPLTLLVGRDAATKRPPRAG